MGEKENNNNQNGSPVTRWFRNAILGATMADQPAMMTASGWRQNEKGDYVQDQQNDPHVKQLRDNLAAEGAGVMLGEFGLPAIHGLYNLGVRGLAKSGNNWARAKVINTKLKDIDKSNAKIITDGEWDDAYNKALASNDMEETQRLRDLHFYSKSNTVIKDKNDMPIETYHTIANRYDPNFTEFNPTIEGTHSAIYTTDDPFMSGSYTKQIVSKEESDLLIQDKINELKNYFSRLISKSKNKDQQIEAFTEYLKYMGTDEIAKQNVINDYPKLIDIHPERMKKLYINLEKPLIMDAKGDSWGHISTAKLPENVWENITNPPSFLSTRDIENLYKHFGYDGAIIKNVVDYGGNKISSRYLTPANVYEVNNPKNLKLSDAITYDDNGEIIPLSKRDDFNNPDIRFGWLTPLFGISTATSLANSQLKMNTKK